MPHRYEWKTGSIAYKSLKKQLKYLEENRQSLYDNVFLWYFERYGKFIDESGNNIDSLEEFWKAMWLYIMIDQIEPYVGKSLLLWYKISFRWNKDTFLDLWMSFDIQNPAVLEYMRNFREIQLSNFAWSISYTTKNAVIGELRKWVSERLSYTEIAKNISALEPSIFSRSRSKLIAVREVGNAYEHGNYIPMYEAQQNWLTVKKYRRTSHDDRVTERCRENEAEGWVWLNHVWGSWDSETPRNSNPRCRCYSKFELQ